MPQPTHNGFSFSSCSPAHSLFLLLHPPYACPPSQWPLTFTVPEWFHSSLSQSLLMANSSILSVTTVNELAFNIWSCFLCFWHFPTHGYLYLYGLLSLFLPASLASWLAGTDIHQKMWEDHPVTWEICLIFIWHWLQVLTFSLGEKDRLKKKREFKNLAETAKSLKWSGWTLGSLGFELMPWDDLRLVFLFLSDIFSVMGIKPRASHILPWSHNPTSILLLVFIFLKNFNRTLLNCSGLSWTWCIAQTGLGTCVITASHFRLTGISIVLHH